MQRSKSTSAIQSSSATPLAKVASFADVTAHRRRQAARRDAADAPRRAMTSVPSPVYSRAATYRTDPFGAQDFYPHTPAEYTDDGAWWRAEEEEHVEVAAALVDLPEEGLEDVRQAIEREDKMGVLSLRESQAYTHALPAWEEKKR
jgi:hypothetical protein